MSLTEKKFGTLSDGTDISSYTLKNMNGASVTLLSFGARVQSIQMPDRHGNFDEMIMGHNELAPYTHRGNYQGAIIGRWANRIKDGQFVINGKEYQVTQNEGKNHLHGGNVGFSHRVWRLKCSDYHDDSPSLTFRYCSPDGEEGFPGKCDVSICYTLSADNALIMDYCAKTTAPTYLNLTNHCYFHLGGPKRDVLSTVLQIEADEVAEATSDLIPTGKFLSVEGACDFRNGKTIGQDIRSGEPLIRQSGGYDHAYKLRGNGMRRVADAFDQQSGRHLRVFTDRPSMQLYTANSFDVEESDHGQISLKPHHAFCLETQELPDAMNHPEFCCLPLLPNEKFHTTTIYKFEI